MDLLEIHELYYALYWLALAKALYNPRSSFDLNRIQAVVKKSTHAITINPPHNFTKNSPRRTRLSNSKLSVSKTYGRPVLAEEYWSGVLSSNSACSSPDKSPSTIRSSSDFVTRISRPVWLGEVSRFPRLSKYAMTKMLKN